jgi:hypothetical protein
MVRTSAIQKARPNIAIMEKNLQAYTLRDAPQSHKQGWRRRKRGGYAIGEGHEARLQILGQGIKRPGPAMFDESETSQRDYFQKAVPRIPHRCGLPGI